MASSTCSLIAFENASPLKFRAYSPASRAARVNAIVLYQPGVAVRPSSDGRSKNTPIVEAPEPKAAVMRDARPKPVEAPITRTFLGPSLIGPRLFTYSICSCTCAAQPTGWAVTQTNPRTLGLMTIGEKIPAPPETWQVRKQVPSRPGGERSLTR